jgi:hypothetical protein
MIMPEDKSKWWKRCVKLTEDSNSDSMVILDLCAQIYGHTKRLHNKVNDLSEADARLTHVKLASLRDQLDQVLPRINAIARAVRNITWLR